MKKKFGLYIIFIIVIFTYCSSNVNVIKLIEMGDIEKAENHCLSLKGEEISECFIILAEYYEERSNYKKAYEYYSRANNNDKANDNLMKMKMTIKIIELDLEKEFVLIKNLGINNVSLNNWSLNDQEINYKYVFEDFILNSNSILQIQSGIKNDEDSNKINENYEYIHWIDKNIWNNNGDTAFLYDEKGVLISKYPEN